MNEWFMLDCEDVIKFREHCQFFEETARILQDNPFSKKILK
jgi:hypothetical protein